MKDFIKGYRIVQELQKRAFDDLYLAENSGVKYVLKRYKDPTEFSPDFNAFIENQETMWPLLQSLGDMVENVVEQFVDDGLLFYQVKDYIEGENLRDWMYGNEDYDQRLDIAVQLCECLKAIHQKGIVLQDFKPENVMLVKNLSKISKVRTVLVDFDWAVPNGKVVRYVGTPGYLSIDGSNLSYKSDIFSLGIVLCELLTGCHPYFYDEDREWEVDLWIEWVKNKDYIRPNKINDELPQAINDIIEKCLEPNPDDRPEIDEILNVLNRKDGKCLYCGEDQNQKSDGFKMKKTVDIVFCIDCTNNATLVRCMRRRIIEFVEALNTRDEMIVDWRARVVGYGDLECEEPIMNSTGFVCDVDSFANQLADLENLEYAGGDDPESTLDAIWYAVCKTDWRDNCRKCVLVLTDAQTKLVNERTLENIPESQGDLDVLAAEINWRDIHLFLWGQQDSIYEPLTKFTKSEICLWNDATGILYSAGLDLTDYIDKVLQLKTRWYADIVFCIDCSSSMASVIDPIKDNVYSFIKGIEDEGERIDWRAEVVGFHDTIVFDNPIVFNSGFVYSLDELRCLLDHIKAEGHVDRQGCNTGNEPRSVLGAIWQVAKTTKWRRNGEHILKHVMVLTDAPPKPICDDDLDEFEQVICVQHITLEIWGKKDPFWEKVSRIPKCGIEQFTDPNEFYYHKDFGMDYMDAFPEIFDPEYPSDDIDDIL